MVHSETGMSHYASTRNLNVLGMLGFYKCSKDESYWIVVGPKKSDWRPYRRGHLDRDMQEERDTWRGHAQ